MHFDPLYAFKYFRKDICWVWHRLFATYSEICIRIMFTLWPKFVLYQFCGGTNKIQNSQRNSLHIPLSSVDATNIHVHWSVLLLDVLKIISKMQAPHLFTWIHKVMNSYVTGTWNYSLIDSHNQWSYKRLVTPSKYKCVFDKMHNIFIYTLWDWFSLSLQKVQCDLVSLETLNDYIASLVGIWNSTVACAWFMFW